MATDKNVSFYMEKELQKYMTPESKNFALISWYRYMFQYIPFRSGIMASLMDYPKDTKNIILTPEQAMLLGIEYIKNDAENVIHFRAPYASVQYEGNNFNFTKDLHPLAQAQWAQVAADLHGEQIIKELKQFIQRSEK